MFKLWSSSTFPLPLTAIDHAAIEQLYGFWTKARYRLRTPTLSELLSQPIEPHLGNMALVEIRPTQFFARYVLVGPGLVRLLGKDPTGKSVNEVYGRSISREVNKVLHEVADTDHPTSHLCEYRILTKRFRYHRLLLPRRAGQTRPASRDSRALSLRC